MMTAIRHAALRLICRMAGHDWINLGLWQHKVGGAYCARCGTEPTPIDPARLGWLIRDAYSARTSRGTLDALARIAHEESKGYPHPSRGPLQQPAAGPPPSPLARKLHSIAAQNAADDARRAAAAAGPVARSAPCDGASTSPAEANNHLPTTGPPYPPDPLAGRQPG